MNKKQEAAVKKLRREVEKLMTSVVAFNLKATTSLEELFDQIDAFPLEVAAPTDTKAKVVAPAAPKQNKVVKPVKPKLVPPTIENTMKRKRS